MTEAASDARPLLSLRGIKKSFGRIDVLRGIDLDIGANEIVALVGDNGAGKSTLIKVITGVHRPTAGELHYKGQPITLHSRSEEHTSELQSLMRISYAVFCLKKKKKKTRNHKS